MFFSNQVVEVRYGGTCTAHWALRTAVDDKGAVNDTPAGRDYMSQPTPDAIYRKMSVAQPAGHT